jgi:hypothetical protein
MGGLLGSRGHGASSPWFSVRGSGSGLKFRIYLPFSSLSLSIYSLSRSLIPQYCTHIVICAKDA